MNLNIYLGMLRQAEDTLAESFRQVADGHAAEREEIETTAARRVEGSGGLVAEGGFEPPTKGL